MRRDGGSDSVLCVVNLFQLREIFCSFVLDNGTLTPLWVVDLVDVLVVLSVLLCLPVNKVARKKNCAATISFDVFPGYLLCEYSSTLVRV